MKNLMKVLSTIIGTAALIIFGVANKTISTLSPKMGKKFTKFTHLWIRTNGTAKKSLYVILLPLLTVLTVGGTTLHTVASDNTAKIKEVSAKSTTAKTENEEVLIAAVKDKVKPKSTKSTEEAKPAKQTENTKPAEAPKKKEVGADMNKVIIPNDYRGKFIKELLPGAVAMGKKYNIYPSVILAQAIIESDWGRSGLSVNAHNYFGVKAAAGQPSVTMWTTEYYDGVTPVSIQDAFAAYENAEGSLESNASLIRNGISGAPEYYAGAWRENAATYADAANSLTNRYATDPNYGPVLISTIETYGLNFAD